MDAESRHQRPHRPPPHHHFNGAASGWTRKDAANDGAGGLVLNFNGAASGWTRKVEEFLERMRAVV